MMRRTLAVLTCVALSGCGAGTGGQGDDGTFDPSTLSVGTAAPDCSHASRTDEICVETVTTIP